MVSVIHFFKCRHAECHYAECRYADCHYAECRYAECRQAECHCAEWRDAINLHIFKKTLLSTQGALATHQFTK
jgi:hypothetical protein